MKQHFTNLRQAIDFLYELEGKGIHLRLKNIKKFLPYLGCPHLKFKSILVAGTNGKGSVSTFLFNALKEHNIKTALYLSPHLLKFNERIQTNDGFISDKELLYEINFVYEKMLKAKVEVSFFEFLTALAFHYFAKKKVKIAVLEVGLGGRLDATNVVKPIASVITSIDFDHMKYLGNTLEKIAKEKAGIIKRNSIVVVGEKRKKLQELIKRIADKKHAKTFIINKDFSFKKLKANFYSQEFIYKFSKTNTAVKVKTRLVGLHQFANASVALTLLFLLKKKLKLNEKKILSAFEKAFIPGRMQLLRKKPLTLLDVAHNSAGIKTLVKSIKMLALKQQFIIVFGCSSDKDHKRMLSLLNPIASEFILSKAVYRGQNPEKLLAALKRINPKTKAGIAENTKKAVKMLLKKKKQTIICGSIYFADEIIKELKKHHACRIILK